MRQPTGPSDPAVALGASLRRLRQARGLSLAGLSSASGVSRGMLSQVELGRSAPTIHLLLRITRALDVSLAALLDEGNSPTPVVLRARAAKVLSSRDGRFSARALFSPYGAGGAEFYELRLAAASVEIGDARPTPTTASLVAEAGRVAVSVAGARHELEPGDAIVFDASLPHELRNDGASEARMYLVIGHASNKHDA